MPELLFIVSLREHDWKKRGTDERRKLQNAAFPVHRTERDATRSIRDALVAEEEFFRSHPVYNSIADRCGIPQLARS
ncbi:hypothetical protein K1719_046607 [Acacia pycnantha]|nr:hypothetical protein K1719_046607 [Acacia pycnantha]